MSGGAFAYRGFMLDVCRHYMPCADIRKLLDAAALLGLNRMHWHLTDDQGWRIEIRRYPKLTETGAFRGDTFFGGTPEKENNCGFYTREEIREIVAYARERGIEIIPEIEMPGHASALLAAYPEMGCRRGEDGRWPSGVEVSGGIFPNLICAGREEVIRFLKDILDEVMELFPYPAIHIGGDEALKIHWRRCPDCRRRMREEGLGSEDALQRQMILEIGEYLAEKGRKTIVWNDVLEGGNLPPHFIVQQWLGGGEAVRTFMQGGGSVICSDTRSCYLDYCYGRIDVATIWEAPRIPDYARGFEDRLIGMECPLWTERVSNAERAAWQLFPRLAAAAVKMNRAEPMSWEAFLEEVRGLEQRIEALGLRGAPESLWRLSPGEAEADREREYRTIRDEAALPYVRKEEKLVLLERTERFMREIGIPEAFLLRAGDAMIAETEGEEPAADDDGAAELIHQMAEAVESRLEGAWKGLPERIWTDTMKCFPRFIGEYRRACGKDGFDRGFWTTRQIRARLFRIGELEYEMTDEPDAGKILSLHIPSDCRLEPERLNDSVREARAFFAEYFPEYAGAPMACESWLLSPALEELLPPQSRILAFRRAFDLTETDPEDDSAVEWVFHIAAEQRKGLRAETLPEDTSLQRGMKRMLLAGRKPGAARGTLARPF